MIADKLKETARFGRLSFRLNDMNVAVELVKPVRLDTWRSQTIVRWQVFSLRVLKELRSPNYVISSCIDEVVRKTKLDVQKVLANESSKS